MREKIELLSDFVPIAGWFFCPLAIGDEARTKLAGAPESARALLTAADNLRALTEWNVANIEAAMRALPEELGVKPKAAFAALRLGISGQSVTPGLFESLWVLGRDEAADRLTRAAALIS